MKKFFSMKKSEDTSGYMESQTAKMLFSSLLLVIFFLIYGVLQERLMTIPYGPNEEMFTFSAFLVLNNRIVVVFVSLCILKYKGESIENVAPLHKYFYISFSNTLATFCQYESLRYISFPTQTLGKCGKMIPVMIISGLMGLKKYQMKDYAAVIFISLGCTLFLLGGDTAPQSGRSADDSSYGILLMFGYLGFDGFTSTFQEKLFKEYSISTYNQMVYVNLTSAILSFMYLLIHDQLVPAVEFIMFYPESYVTAFGLSLASCLGQLVIYYMIKNFGALVFATAMVFRHIVAIVLSCILFFHPLTPYQWLAGFIVLGTFYAHNITKKRGHKSEEKDKEVKLEEGETLKV